MGLTMTERKAVVRQMASRYRARPILLRRLERLPLVGELV